MCYSLSNEIWRKIFIVFNSLFTVGDLVLLVLGIIVQWTLSNYSTILQSPLPAIFPTIIFTGCFGLLTSSIGYVGLWKPMHWIAITHIVGLCIVTLIETVIATASAVLHDQFNTTTHTSLLHSIKFFYNISQYEIEMNRLQTEFTCCGVESYLDYRKIGSNIPFSCIIGYLVYAKGCAELLSHYVEQYTIALITLCFLFAIIQAIYLIISILMLNRSIDSKNLCT
ncbi:unnamed protein product [Schistosoma turkestanicum]|nr:unnamed protein product [Schistosoma turkestanicum]